MDYWRRCVQSSNWLQPRNNINIMCENYNSYGASNRTSSKKGDSSSGSFRNTFLTGPQHSGESSGVERLLSISRQNLMQAVQIHSWRSKTSLPILRTVEYEVITESQYPDRKLRFRSGSVCSKNTNKSDQQGNVIAKISEFIQEHVNIPVYELRVRTEEIRCRLKQIPFLPFAQAVHLVKEILIGFEVLIDIFGLFEPTEAMVSVNTRDQWRVWINEDFSLNSKTEAKLSQKEFIYKLLLLAERHCIISYQSKLFFSMLKQFTYEKDCSFIKTLEKVNQFVAVHRIYHVNKVILPQDRNQHHETNKKGIQDRVTNVKNHLKRLITPNCPQSEAKISHKYNPSNFYINQHNVKSVTNLTAQPINKNSQFVSHPIINNQPYSPSNHTSKGQPRINTTSYISQLSPPSPAGLEKSASFQQLCDAWNQGGNDQVISNTPSKGPERSLSIQCIQTPQSHKVLPSSPNGFQNTNRARRFNNLTQFPLFRANKQQQSSSNLTPAKHRHQIKIIANQQKKPVSNLNIEQAKRPNIRKYSEQLMKIKSADLLFNKQRKFHCSNIYKNTQQNEKNGQIIEQQEPITQKPHVSFTSTNNIQLRQNSQLKQCVSSPHNSSSTKELQNSGQSEKKYIGESSYTTMKMKDLGIAKYKNNHSVINFYGRPEHHNLQDQQKNMTVSHQFQKNHNSESESDKSCEKGKKPEQNRWVNKISDLFSDTTSIKHLKESINFKTHQQKLFEKQYLKDVKLDMLQKFGRNVKICEQDDDHRPNKKYHKHQNQYKSMQLIEEELEEVKSYQEDDRREEDIVSRSIKSIRSRKQTMEPCHSIKDKQISFKDFFYKREEDDIHSQRGGFNFQSEIYRINGQKYS